MLDDHRSEQVITSWDGHHPLLCELSISSLTAFHEHMGCTNVRVRRTSCVLDARLAARHALRPSSTKVRAVRPAELAAVPTAPLAPPSEARVETCRFLIQWDERR